MSFYIRNNFGAGHSPGQGCVTAKRFAVYKVAPSSYALADKHCPAGKIKERKNFLVAQFAADKKSDNSADYAAIKAKAAAADIENFCKIIFKHIPLERHIICPCANDADDNSKKDNVHGSFGIYAESFCVFKKKHKRKHKACGNYYGIPVNIYGAY